MEIYRPDEDQFLTSVELDQLRKQEKQRADYQQQRADRLAALLQERGIDPNELL